MSEPYMFQTFFSCLCVRHLIFDCKWWQNQGLFLYIRSCRLRAFALPGLRASAAKSFLGCLMQMFGIFLQMFPPFVCLCDLISEQWCPMMTKSRRVSLHLQLPRKSFRPARLESLCCKILPWMSEDHCTHYLIVDTILFLPVTLLLRVVFSYACQIGVSNQNLPTFSIAPPIYCLYQ